MRKASVAAPTRKVLCMFVRVSHNTPFFELSYVLLTTHAIGLEEATKNFSVIDSKMGFRERFLFLMGIYGNFNGEMARF